MNIKFAISSCADYWKATYPRVVESLMRASVPASDIYFFVGGYEKYTKVDDQVNFYEVDHNSFDFTGLVSIIDLQLKSDYWFLLHDTCYVGENFYKAIQNFKYDSNIIKLSSGLSMNMGAYSQSYLEHISGTVLNYKNQKYDIDSMQAFKTRCVQHEDYFFRGQGSNHYSGECKVESPVDYYTTGVMRIIEYYDAIDLYKIKANWTGKVKYELNL